MFPIPVTGEDKPKPIPGFTVGRVVHYAPRVDEVVIFGGIPGDPINARLTRVEDAVKGLATLHLDTFRSHAPGASAAYLAPVNTDVGNIELGPFVAVARSVQFDESGKPGTFRWPPRV